MREIVTLTARPDLISTIADWMWQEWDRHDGIQFEETISYFERCLAGRDIPQTFVLLVDGSPIGTSSLVEADLKERPDFSPWMANVFVSPEARRNGYVMPLIRTVEDVAVAVGIPTLWLHTESAEPIYRKAGWRTVEVIQREGGRKPVTLMRRELRPTI